MNPEVTPNYNFAYFSDFTSAANICQTYYILFYFLNRF